MGLSDLPEFIPLDEAAERHHVNPQLLDRAVVDGTVRAVRVGESLLVDNHDVAIITVQMKKPSTGGDELVSISEAARRLELSSRIVLRWQEYGWLPAVATGPRRAKMVSWTRAKELDALRQARGRRRVIPKNRDFGYHTAKQ